MRENNDSSRTPDAYACFYLFYTLVLPLLDLLIIPKRHAEEGMTEASLTTKEQLALVGLLLKQPYQRVKFANHIGTVPLCVSVEVFHN